MRVKVKGRDKEEKRLREDESSGVGDMVENKSELRSKLCI